MKLLAGRWRGERPKSAQDAEISHEYLDPCLVFKTQNETKRLKTKQQTRFTINQSTTSHLNER